MSHYVYSTLGAPMAYTAYIKNDVRELPIEESVIHIKGGAGVMDAKNIQTPRGVVTEINDDELKALRENEVFKMHEAGGYIIVEAKNAPVEKVVKNMNEKDKSKPLTPDNFVKDKDGKNKLNRTI